VYIHTIDIAHPPLTSTAAEDVLDDELMQVRHTQKWRVMKVVHGYGNHERPGVLKQVVRNWAHRNQSRIRCIITGEEYHLHNLLTQEMRKDCGQVQDKDLGAANPGITMIWVR
jgi:hypothetical protein